MVHKFARRKKETQLYGIFKRRFIDIVCVGGGCIVDIYRNKLTGHHKKKVCACMCIGMDACTFINVDMLTVKKFIKRSEKNVHRHMINNTSL